MNTNTIVAGADGPRNYWPLKYLGDTPMITQAQKEKLTALIYQNISDDNNERELRLSELEDLTQADADYVLYQFSTGQWS